MNKSRLGALQVALAAISWSFAGALSKSLPWNSLTINGVRSLVAALLLALARGGVRVRLTKGTLLGAAGTALTGMLYMLATKLTTSAHAIVLQYAMPIFVILFSWLFYGQKPGAKQVIIAACILAGVALCSWEGFSGGNTATAGGQGTSPEPGECRICRSGPTQSRYGSSGRHHAKRSGYAHGRCRSQCGDGYADTGSDCGAGLFLFYGILTVLLYLLGLLLPL